MGQISVLTGPERRRRWSEDERCRIVAEAFAPGSCVAQVARDHDISTGLIYTWRRRLRQDLADQGFVEAAMEAEPIKEAAPSGEVIVVELTGSGRIHAEDDKGMPFSLSLLVLPLCLQQSSRETLQRANRSYFLKVVADHPELLVGFGKRCTDVLPFTLEGLGLLMHCDAVMVSPDGRLVPNSAGVRKTINGSDESKACQRVAAFMGKEFARIAERGTIYTTLGVRP